jgi:hypothetical protein
MKVRHYESFQIDDTPFLGVSSLTSYGKHIGIFDYDKSSYSDMMTIYHNLPTAILLETSKGNHQLIIPTPMYVNEIISLYHSLLGYKTKPCQKNFALGLLRDEWVSRITPKNYRGIEVVAMKRQPRSKISSTHWSLYARLYAGKSITNLPGLVEYHRYSEINFIEDIEV